MGTGINIYDFLLQEMNKGQFEIKNQDICSYSPLTLAYIGDGIYELIVRSFIVGEGNAPVNRLHKRSSELVKAQTQARMVKYYLDNNILKDEELRYFKRGRNAQSYTKAKNASMADYRLATGFEALMGYLYVTGQCERMLELAALGIKLEEEEK